MTSIRSIKDLREVILSAIEKYNKIGLLTHKNPDGDGLSTCLVLQELIRARGKETSIILETEAPESLDFIGARERSIIYRDKLSFPLILVVDSQDRNRLGICAPLLDSSELAIAIDHHIENGKSLAEGEEDSIRDIDMLYNEPYKVSAGAIVYQILKPEIESLSRESRQYCATALYVSIINDTNNFTNKNTDAEVFRICSELAEMDIKPHEITGTFLLKKSPDYYKFIGQALSTIKTVAKGRVLFFHSTMQMLSENNLGSDATSKVTNWVKKPKGVEVVVYFREIADGKYRLSLRSERIDVNEIAARYGGGGHRVAAGCEISGKLIDIESLILSDIEVQLHDV